MAAFYFVIFDKNLIDIYLISLNFFYINNLFRIFNQRHCQEGLRDSSEKQQMYFYLTCNAHTSCKAVSSVSFLCMSQQNRVIFFIGCFISVDFIGGFDSVYSYHQRVKPIFVQVKVTDVLSFQVERESVICVLK